MWHSEYYLKTIIITIWLLMISCSAGSPGMKGEKYLITAEEDAESERWAAYLFHHLSKRTEEINSVELHKGVPPRKMPKGVKNIHFEVAPDLKNDYCIEHTSKRLHIRVRKRNTALWLVYQLMDCISIDDHRFVTDDFSPGVIDFSTGCKDFDFNYREPFFAANLQPEYAPVLGTNCVDTDWGTWGHSLPKIVEDRGDEKIYALVEGERNKEQFCFASPGLFEQLKEYIIDYFGDEDEQSIRFMIMPNDNDLVCTCPDCIQLGNTKNNATPAVHDLIRRLAERFPNHQFFTTAYRTTATPPAYQLPENSGVFFSTIDLPKGVTLDRQSKVKTFVGQIHGWRYKTPDIYLWDYAANFDDYLTPIPILLSLQAQLQFFKRQGVRGLFLNGSGYDYSPFDDVKTFVAGALMMDVDVNVEALIKRYHQKMYPRNHELISNYYISLEKRFFDKNRPYNMYGGMRDNVKTYLDMDEFIRFYEALGNVIPATTGEEREKLEKLYTALAFTRLQIAYIQGDREWGYARKENTMMRVKPEITLLIEELRQFANYEDMQNYKESGGSLSEYIGQWEQLLNPGEYENALLGIPVEVLSNADEGFETAGLLTNGTPGFLQDYHHGWYSSGTDDLHIRFPAYTLQTAKFIRLRFLHMQRHGIYPPAGIELIVDGRPVTDQRIDTSYEEDEKESYGVSYSLPVNLNGARSIELKIIRRKESPSILALDEIQVLNHNSR
ncbi:DUF4838 domain-containing protein [uncultured Proteiniphilum sp.]|uniref:DUF4838 domain-containing protein n=1 Tax=uncultured Proteiniphilum sp. TaxID=497637 RepID=UPI00260A923A|nr:DUF4838 domain-containing protein [uncultured Proteiniphilum sp.]